MLVERIRCVCWCELGLERADIDEGQWQSHTKLCQIVVSIRDLQQRVITVKTNVIIIISVKLKQGHPAIRVHFSKHVDTRLCLEEAARRVQLAPAPTWLVARCHAQLSLSTMSARCTHLLVLTLRFAACLCQPRPAVANLQMTLVSSVRFSAANLVGHLGIQKSPTPAVRSRVFRCIPLYSVVLVAGWGGLK